MGENIPRRMQRYYRQGEQKTQSPAEEEGKEDYLSPTGRPILQSIPSMDYEDLKISKEKIEELKRMQQKNYEQKKALEEIEKFKKQNNRLPTKEESEQIAENLYSQLKNAGADDLHGISAQQSAHRELRKHGRNRQREEEKQIPVEQATEQISPQPSTIEDVKVLLGEDETKGKEKKKIADEFDLGFGEDIGEEKETGEEEIDEIESIDNEETEFCPNCKKAAEKIIYCPKCGTAFCEKCAKKQNDSFLCPKCGAKTKG